MNTRLFINQIEFCICFSDTQATVKLNTFVFEHIHQYFDLVQSHIESQQDGGDSAILVRALDRFYRRLTAVNSLFSDEEYIE